MSRSARQGLAALALGLLMSTPLAAKTFVFVSAAEDGIVNTYAMDQKTGVLTQLAEVKAGPLVMPMALNPKHPVLYAVLRSKPFEVVSYQIDPMTGGLTERARTPLPDSMPYATTDHTGRFLFTASFGGDKVAISPGAPREPVAANATNGANTPTAGGDDGVRQRSGPLICA